MTAVRKEEETKEMGKIIGICISEKRGTAKHEVETHFFIIFQILHSVSRKMNLELTV